MTEIHGDDGFRDHVRIICAHGGVPVVVKSVKGSAATLCRLLGYRPRASAPLFAVSGDDARAIFGAASLVADLIDPSAARVVTIEEDGKIAIARLTPDGDWISEGTDLPPDFGSPEDPGGAVLAPA